MKRLAISSCIILLAVTAIAQQTTKQSIKGASTSTTQQLKGEVVYVEGNNLAVKMSTGDLRTFNIPESRRFIIDGTEMSVHQLKPGTKLNATVTTTQTSVTDRTTTVGTGKVWYVAPPTVILTLPNGENRVYKTKSDYKFTVEGREATVFELRKGMTVAAEKIVEEPRTELATNVVVTGTAPAASVAQAPAPVKETPAAAPTPAPAKRAAAAPPATPAEPAATPAPATLPKTGGALPLIGLAGILLTAFSLSFRALRRGR